MANLTIGISDLKVCRPPDVLVTYALGSCVGICLLDSVAGVGGLSHIMLPDSTQANQRSRYSDEIRGYRYSDAHQGDGEARSKQKPH